MGILQQKDVFTAKYITALITDSGNRLFFVPIKQVLGDFFLVEIEKQIYCFKIDGTRIKTYRHTLVRSCRFLEYDTDNYMPVNSSQVKALEQILELNSLPKVDRKLYNVFRMLSAKEKKLQKGEPFTPYELVELINEIAKHEKDHPQQVDELKTFIEGLDTKQIVTPLKKVTEFLTEDFIATEASFFGNIGAAYQRTDFRHKQVTNTPEKGKVAWIKVIAIVAILVGIVAIGNILYSSGAFTNGVSLPGFASTSSTGTDNCQGLMAEYTPSQLKAKIDGGEIKENTLCPQLKAILDHMPKATPKS